MSRVLGWAVLGMQTQKQGCSRLEGIWLLLGTESKVRAQMNIGRGCGARGDHRDVTGRETN